MEIKIKIEKKLIVKILAAISIIIFIIAICILRPTFGNKISRVSYVAENKRIIGKISVDMEIHTKSGFKLKDANVTVRLTTEDGTFEQTFDTENVKAQQEFIGNYDHMKLEVRVNSYHVTGYAKYVAPSVIMFLISGAGMVYCVYYWTCKQSNNKDGEQ